MQFKLRRFAPIARALPLFATLLFAPTLLWGGERKHSGNESLFSEAEYREHITYLASDELEGRGTGQAGIDRAAEYIAAEFEKCGVKPAGDDDTYFQNFSLQLHHKLGDGTYLAFGRNARKLRIPLELHKDFVPFPFSSSKSFEGDVVFAGYGIVNDDKGYNDYSGLDVTDKVVLMIRRAPEFGDFNAMQDQSFRAKASRANARGAAAVLIVNRNGDGDEALYPFEQGMGGRSYGVPMIHITEAAADELLDAAGMPSIADLQKKIESAKKPASEVLKGVTIRGEVDIQPIDSPVRNVVGLIPGQGPQSDEIIVLGAHYDHLGIRNKGEPEFDSTKDISNGADDNASGTSLVMSMAKAYTAGPPPNRSILLTLFTGEELGLLGSAHFAKHPTVDLSDCIAMLNFDMVGRLKNDRLEVGGMRTGSGFEDLVENLADRYDIKIRDGGGGRGPSDHTNFYNKKIPVLFFFTGIHRQYHRPEDDTPLINFEGAIRIARYASDIIDEIDSNPKRPEYHSDTRQASIGRQSDDDDKPEATEANKPRRPNRGDRTARRGDGENRAAQRGVRLGIVPDEDAEDGLVVLEVDEGSAAASAGVEPGDRIVRIGKIDIGSVDDAVETLSKLESGDRTTLGVKRDGKLIELKIGFARAKRGPGRGSKDDSLLSELKTLVESAQAKVDNGGKCRFEVHGKGKDFEIEITAPDATTSAKIVLQVSGELLMLSAHHRDATFKLKVTGERGNSGVQIFNVSLSFTAKAASEEKKDAVANPHAADDAHGRKARRKNSDPHDDAADDEARQTMPPVRLGIMPTYGKTEGEGYEIDGVTEGGPAAKAGMKDGDRIYQIGDKKITDVYEYMDALRKYKPGDEIPVVVIREGKKIELKVKAGEAKAEPN